MDPESLFPRVPSPRRIRANHNLFLLRRTATVLWVVPPLIALLWAFVPWRKVTSARAHWWSWLRRNRENLLLARSAAVVDRTRPRTDWRVASLYCLVVVLFLQSIWRLHDPDTGFTSFIGFGRQFEEFRLPVIKGLPHAVVENAGYDGQFYAQLALDPLLRNPDLRTALDSLPYRSRRILVPWTAFLIGLGHPSWILEVYALQNVGFWLMLGWVLLRWLPPINIRNWLAWCGCLLSVGSIVSVRLALTDLPGAAIMALGLAMAESGRSYLAGFIVGLSGLARETNLIAILGFDWWGRWKTHRVRALLTGLLVLSPVVLWMLYLQALLGPRVWPVDQSGTLVLPFGGIAEFLRRASFDVQMSGWGAPVFRGLLALLGVGVQAVYLIWRADWHRPWWRVGIAYAAFFLIFPMPVLEGNPGAFVRVLIPLTLAFNVLIPQSRWFWPLFVLGNATIVQGLQSLSLLPW